MKYRQIQPPGHLKGYIRHFWVLENDAAGSLAKAVGPVVDGCPGLIFQQQQKGAFMRENKQLPEIFLYGQTTRHTDIISTGQFSTVGAIFYPNALKSVFGMNAGELTDNCVDLSLVQARKGKRLSEQLAGAASVTEQLEALSSYVFQQVNGNRAPADEAIIFAVAAIIESRGSIALKELQDKLQLSERSFERRFKEWVGISPKLFSRICRFQASLSQLRSNSYSKLSDIAYENGYADQSHFIRVFREFAGDSPFRYQQQACVCGEPPAEPSRL